MADEHDSTSPEQPGIDAGMPPAPEPVQAPPAAYPETPRPPHDFAGVGPVSPPPERPARTGCGVIVLAAVIAFVVAAFAGLAAGLVGARLGTMDVGQTVRQPSRIRILPSATEEPVIAASAAAVPAVVNIDVRGSASSAPDPQLPEGHEQVPAIYNGSGVAYKTSKDGTYIITNNHVVQGASRITVRDDTGRTHAATLVGRDPETDIAVVRIRGRITPIEIADSAKLLVGQTVVAIGSPFGLEHSVTSGVVSALGRSLPDFTGSAGNAYPLVDVIQTDAAINPGNSGGALVDLQGRLIGINTAIYSESGASGGIGFAVPSNTALRVAGQIVSGKAITHPFIGIIGTTVSQELAREEKLAVEEGAYVSELVKGSGAEKAGVKVGDVVVAVGGQPTRSMDDLILQIRRKKVGDSVTLKLRRGKQTLELKVTVGDKPARIESGEPTGTR